MTGGVLDGYVMAAPFTGYEPEIAPFLGYSSDSDADIRRQLEVEILEQWFNAESDELPPDFSDADPELAAKPWEPASVAQRTALECEADIILYGGQAGTYKSETLLVRAAVEVDNPNYNAIIFRQSFPELRDLVKKSIRLYKMLGGKFTKGSPLCWTFPSGATIWMGYLGHDDDVFSHQGAEYSFIGFDEAGHQTEARIRYMLTRLRSPDKSLKLTMFLTANPGGPGHSLLMHMFLKGVCPHCEPSRAVESGKLYYDASWKSDTQPLSTKLKSGKYIPISVAFIRGKLQAGDTDLLGEEYEAKLKIQASATAQMLLDGCWKAWEGQFFDCFDERRGWGEDGKPLHLSAPGVPDMRMVVDHTELDVKWWYPHLVDGDYGFAGSSAAAHLLVQLPADEFFKNGRILVLDEYLEPGVTAKDYAQQILDRWVLEEDGAGNKYLPSPCRAVHQWVVSPDAFRKDGSVNDQDVPFSRLEQMNGVLAQWGFQFMRANDDRKSGWMKLYQMLRDGELVIAKRCKHTIEALQTRLKDPKKMDDILKVPGDPLDDIIDALRYGIMTWNMAVIKPREIRVAEAIEGKDPTNAAMTMRAIELSERGVGRAVSFSPKASRRRPF